MGLDNHTSASRHAGGELRSISGRGHRNQWLSHQLIAAVDRLDHGALSEVMAIAGCAEAVKASGWGIERLCAALKRQVAIATKTSDPNKLQAVWQVTPPLLGALPGEPRLGYSAERLVVEMQRADPVGAARMTLEAVQQGWSPKPKTNFFTLMGAQWAARSWEELSVVTDLSVRLLDMGRLDLTDGSTVERLNVLLACICDPRPAHQRIGEAYAQEVSISDVARRIQLGAQVAYAAVRAGVEFSTAATARRIDMSIRGIASVGTVLGLECASRQGLLTERAVEEASHKFGLGFAWVPPDWQREDLQTLRAVSEGLLVAAVDIALSCFVEVDDGEQGSRADLRYALNGHTVSNIVLGVCVAKVACDDARCLAVAELLSQALQVSYVAKEVGRRAIQTALNWMDCDGVDPAARGAAILTVLSGAIPRISDANLLERMATRVCEYANAVPEMEATCLLYLDAMSARLDELTAQREGAQACDSGAVSGSVNVPRGKAESTWFSDLVTEAVKRDGT